MFGIQGTVLSWFRSYLTKRFQIVSIQGTNSDPTELCCDVPQGSVLGPILFIIYTQPLTSVILKYPISHMLYADDTQVYTGFARSLESLENRFFDFRLKKVWKNSTFFQFQSLEKVWNPNSCILKLK